MHDKKLTDNEIIKALECCSNWNGDEQCKKCPFECECELNQLEKLALDLITRLQAENENLKDILYDAEGVNLVNYWYQQCKIAENGCRNFEEENKSLKAENERLNFEKASDHENLQQVLVMLDELKEEITHDIKLAKAEAYKKFAYRFKDKFNDLSTFNINIVFNTVDNLLKEMVGEDNG